MTYYKQIYSLCKNNLSKIHRHTYQIYHTIIGPEKIKSPNTKKVTMVLQFQGHKALIKDKSRLFSNIGLCEMHYVQKMKKKFQ